MKFLDSFYKMAMDFGDYVVTLSPAMQIFVVGSMLAIGVQLFRKAHSDYKEMIEVIFEK
jgi:hypothetical protein